MRLETNLNDLQIYQDFVTKQGGGKLNNSVYIVSLVDEPNALSTPKQQTDSLNELVKVIYTGVQREGSERYKTQPRKAFILFKNEIKPTTRRMISMVNWLSKGNGFSVTIAKYGISKLDRLIRETLNIKLKYPRSLNVMQASIKLSELKIETRILDQVAKDTVNGYLNGGTSAVTFNLNELESDYKDRFKPIIDRMEASNLDEKRIESLIAFESLDYFELKSELTNLQKLIIIQNILVYINTGQCLNDRAVVILFKIFHQSEPMYKSSIANYMYRMMRLAFHSKIGLKELVEESRTLVDEHLCPIELLSDIIEQYS